MRIARDGEPADIMTGADQAIFESSAGTCSTPDANELPIVLDEERDEGWEEFKLFAEIQSSAICAAKLAFTFPRELVDHIVDLFDGFQPGHREWKMATQIGDLGSWSLVCLDWARKCRALLHKEAEITSRESALRFRALLKGPCSDRLTPLLDLIETLEVRTDPKTDAWSWHHLLTTIAPAVPADKFGGLSIIGRDNPRFGSSIHWGVPSAVSVLPVPYRKLYLEDLHCASLQSILQLIRSLPRLEVLYLLNVKWDEDGTRAPVGNVPPENVLPGNVTPGRQLRSTLTYASFRLRQDATPLLLCTLSAGCTPLQMIPLAEQRTIIQLVEGFDAVITAEGHGMFKDCSFGLSEYTSPETGITTGWLSLDAGDDHVYLSFHYRQTIIGCTVLISRHEYKSSTSLPAFASDHLWRSLAHFTDLRYLVVGLSDVDAMQILAETHQDLWEPLRRRLHYHRFASRLDARDYRTWVGHDPVSLEQTDEKWDDSWDVRRSLADKM